MILKTLDGVRPSDFAGATGWDLNPQGLCRGEMCVPAPGALRADGSLDVEVAAAQLGMPMVHDETTGIRSIGPATISGHALDTAVAADPTLADRDGNPFKLSSLLGRKVILVAWASY